MSEEEIVKVITYKLNMKNADVYAPILYDEIQNLLDLYNKEKEKNLFLEGFKVGAEEAIKELKEKNKKLEEHQKQYLDGELITSNQGKFFEKIIKENYIRKDKIRNLAENIKEQRNFYDKDEEAEWGQYNKYETYDYFYKKIKELLEE